ncbi:hypothetical protein BH708_12845 [Brachybacterium sp. P6-10-X1]|uniref:hypothetical protein n=1 Tax=Brachybacterium sp. P6-10-X1 TaxID=1903186 RepID=UPI0009719B6C|nr:hypothetical protein [Brachybacterium sp. P6-10-X1]APX33456.1 hypothetical protein BH708_12845 [Brachybacterium sp. P6-10-X1]
MSSRPGRPVVALDIGGTLLDSTGAAQEEAPALLPRDDLEADGIEFAATLSPLAEFIVDAAGEES